MSAVRSLSTLCIFSLLIACVTINVYFPAAAAETAAQTIVRDVLGEQPPGPPQQQVPGSDQESRILTAPDADYRLSIITDLLISPASAQADIKINTPLINQLRASLKMRQSKLQPHLDSGALGLDRDALVSIRNLSAVPLKARNRVKKLVADENKDRNALYKEIARANGHPEWEKNIRQIFARVWVQESGSGVWYMDAKGEWRQKR